jgi:uncharacterized protein YecE (DUF72 family)
LGVEPNNLRIGTSAFTAAGREAALHSPGMKPADYLRSFATRFNSVQVDSTSNLTPPKVRAD